MIYRYYYNYLHMFNQFIRKPMCFVLATPHAHTTTLRVIIFGFVLLFVFCVFIYKM